MHAPYVERLAQRLTESDDPEIQIAYVKEAKKELPVEVGAALTGGRRKDDAVESISWLFVDVDGVEDVEAVKLLHGVLKEASINHLLIESPTSRLAIGTESRGLRVSRTGFAEASAAADGCISVNPTTAPSALEHLGVTPCTHPLNPRPLNPRPHRKSAMSSN